MERVNVLRKISHNIGSTLHKRWINMSPVPYDPIIHSVDTALHGVMFIIDNIYDVAEIEGKISLSIDAFERQTNVSTNIKEKWVYCKIEPETSAISIYLRLSK